MNGAASSASSPSSAASAVASTGASAPPATTASAVAKSASSPLTSLDQAMWSAVPSLIWAILILAILVYFRTELSLLVRALVFRVRDGAAFKVAGLEIGAASGLVARPGDFSKEDTRVGVRADNGTRRARRDGEYINTRGVMLVHRLQRSTNDGQLYDVLIYVIPHKSSLAGVVTVEYFFGSYWGNKIYPSIDRSRGFPVVTSAYGPFLCTAKIIFNDGDSTFVSRYIDFEMGNCAPSASVSK